MTQADMLNEHLNVIYIIEDLNLSKLKSQAKKIGDAASSGNILRIKKVFDSLPNIPLNDLKLTAKKKFGLNIKAKTKDPELQLKISKTLAEMKKLYNKVEIGMTVDGITLLAVASIIKFLFGAILIVPLLQISGVFFIAIAVFSLMVGSFVKIFIEAKKAKQRFVS
jgi:hypothetical protein